MILLNFMGFYGILWEFIVVTSGLNYKINSWKTVLVFRSEWMIYLWLCFSTSSVTGRATNHFFYWEHLGIRLIMGQTGVDTRGYTRIISGWWCNNHLEKYESQWERLSHILWKIKNVPNHQPVLIYIYIPWYIFHYIHIPTKKHLGHTPFTNNPNY